MQFWGFSVLQRHGVLLPGGDFFHGVFPFGGPNVKVAKSHSSSKRKKEPKASFSIGFRSYVRHFRGAILGASPSFRGMVFCCREVIFSMVLFPFGDRM